MGSKRERERESLSSCCRRKMKEEETRERNDKTGSVIAIDLSAISRTVFYEHLRGGRRKGGRRRKTKRDSS